jgi:TPR repeat protein
MLEFLVLVATLEGSATRAPGCQELKRSADQRWAAWRRYGSPAQERLLRDAVAACDGGDIDCCLQAGSVYRDRVSSTADRRRAPALFERACSAGNGEACWALSEVYRNGEGGIARSQDATNLQTRATTLLTTSCEDGTANACLQLGRIYGSGAIEEKGAADSVEHYRRGLALFQASCKGGHLPACLEWARLADEIQDCNGQEAAHTGCDLPLPRGAIAVDVSLATAMYERGCDSGDAGACSELSLRFLLGTQGVHSDKTKGAALLRRACDLGFAQGCLFLGWAYEKGKHHVLPELRGSVGKSDAEAAAFYERGCHHGDALSCYELGDAYINGRLGLQKDAKAGMELLRQACEDGFPKACETLR